MKATALIDWFTFSVKGAVEPDQVIRDYLNIDADLFQDNCFGNFGYTRSKSLNGLMVYYAPAEDRIGDMGVCVSMSGKGARTFEAHTRHKSKGTPFIALARMLHIDDKVNITRVDLALDDKAGLLDLEVIADAVRDGHINSRIRDRRCIEGYDVEKKAGMTIYLGAPQSEFRIRIYDKSKEQYKPNEPEYNQHWVRFEMVMRGDNANGFLNCLVNSENLGLLASGILNDKLSFIERDDSNISRCSFSPWWVKFLETLEAVDLVSKEEIQHSMERSIEWISRYIAPTLSLINDAKGYFMIREFLSIGAAKRTKQQAAMLEDYRHVYRKEM